MQGDRTEIMKTKTLQEIVKPEHNTSSFNKNLGLYELLSFDDLPKSIGNFFNLPISNPGSTPVKMDFGARYNSVPYVPEISTPGSRYNSATILGHNCVRNIDPFEVSLAPGRGKDINLPGWADPYLNISTRIDTPRGLPENSHMNLDINLVDGSSGRSRGYNHPLGRKGFNRFTGLFENDD